MSTDKQNIDNELAMAILNGLSGPNACKGADERRRMIPLHVADQAVAACEKEIQELRAENARLKAEVERLTKAGDAMLAEWENTQAGHWAIDDAKPMWKAAKEGKPNA